LESELGDDAVDGSFADAEVALSELLSDDLGAGFGIQEAMTDDLADEFLGAPVIGFGAPLGAEEALSALGQKAGPELEVTLTAEAELLCGAVDAVGSAFAFDEHGELASDLVPSRDGEGPGGALDAFPEKLEGNHGNLLVECQQ
jgi:hypothetical protein